MSGIRQRIVNLSYRRRLLFSYITLTFLIMILAFGILAALIYNIISQSESRHLHQLVSVVNADMESRIANINSTGFDLNIDSSLRESLNKTGDIELSRARTKIGSILKLKLISNNYLRGLMVLDTALHLYSPQYSLVLPEGFSLEDTGIYQAAAQGLGGLVWLSQNDLYDKYAPVDGLNHPDTNIHAASVIMDYSHQRLLGLIILSLNQSYFYNISYPNGLLPDSDLYLVSPDRKATYAVAGTDAPLPEAVLSRLTFGEEISQFMHGGRLITCHLNKAMNWYLISITATTALNQGVTDILLTLLIVLLVGLALSVFLSHSMATYSSRGITELIQGMDRLESEDFDVEVPIVRQDELGRITRAFNHMVKRIRRLIVTEYQQKLLMQEACFKVLQSQINPHFLMNTFDMLHWKLLDKGEEQLAETVVALSHLMQYSMESEQWSVSLSQEKRNIEEYVAVHTVIRGYDIRLDVRLTDEDSVFLPRQTLQPLAENAIRHGFAGRVHGNVLLIEGGPCPEDASVYRLAVWDNGLGIQPEELESINASLSSTVMAGEAHIGLQNVAARLRYMYPGASLALESEYGAGTRVIMLFAPSEEADT